MKKKTLKRKRKTTARKTVKRRVARKKAAPKRRAVAKVASLEKVGTITHYFPKVKAGVMKMTKGLALGDLIHVKGHTTDFKQKVGSIQLNHVPLKRAKARQEIGFRVKSRVRQNDIVYKLS